RSVSRSLDSDGPATWTGGHVGCISPARALRVGRTARRALAEKLLGRAPATHRSLEERPRSPSMRRDARARSHQRSPNAFQELSICFLEMAERNGHGRGNAQLVVRGRSAGARNYRNTSTHRDQRIVTVSMSPE